ncbi:hypothetical protein ACRALDRAFT_1053174 [Sodiomyces alcalophilus JCM 7366]|uniref:uncharacterized protein n=1 Tax=Sodiomyces alcalophilus JCM 7366 TaxID=591952 RepID=UPI0039B4BC6F
MSSPTPIAVIGMSCRLPGGANSPEELWDMLSKGRSAWGPVPPDRWNADAFYHPDTRAKESLVFRSGFFLDQDIAAFDARFWSIPPREANGMDPQQRLLLESTYEALENAGIPLNSLKGSKTAVYVAEFPRDYDRMAYKDLPQLHRLHVTGKGDAILSNRISYLLDLKGPSLTIDTGCSGSLVALHQACQSIRTGESDLAIVGGSQLILHPDQTLSMNQIGMMNPDGKCYVFDDRGDGYARGEGTAAVVLKRLDEAIKDNDPIQAVIVHSGVNQDGKTQGIQLPNADAQAALAKSVYEEAGLDPAKTVYVEAHGTGTQVGDAAEMSSIYQVFCHGKERERDILVGSVKANIGHLESTSGLAGLLKAILTLKNGQVPGVLDLQTPKPALELGHRPIKVPLETTDLVPHDHHGPVRVSVNGFGYGGTNAHLILEAAPEPNITINQAVNGHYGITNGHPEPKPVQNGAGKVSGGPSPEATQPRLFVLSAASGESLRKGAENLKAWVTAVQPDTTQIRDLSFTLLSRRTHHTHRAVIVASDAAELIEKLGRVDVTRSREPSNVQVTFVFTGQGAQWYAMGRELLTASAKFRDSIIKSTEFLKAWGSEWNLLGELSRDEAGSKLSVSELAQPATTALQIALVDMLFDAGIRPQAVCGHSSGEIGAGYASGALTHEAALKISYLRGICSSLAKKTNACPGAMLAVGLGEDKVAPHVERVKSGRLTVACINSPESTTISGDEAAIDELRDTLESLSIFNRKLQVDTAYHSHHMMTVADDYMLSLKDIEHSVPRPDTTFFSTVSGEAKLSEFGPSYWTQNAVSPVQFERALAAVATAMRSENSSAAKVFVEIGPHSALLGPARQIFNNLQGSFSYTYTSVLVRKKNALQTTLESVGELHKLGYAFDPASVLSPTASPSVHPKPRVLQDLPKYPWDHSTTYWHESRLSKSHRLRQFPYHDLIGLLDVVGDAQSPRWRYHVGIDPLPWLQDHVVDGFVILPGSSYLCMAIEAMTQFVQMQGKSSAAIKRFLLRNITFSKSLVIPGARSDGDSQDVELQVSLVSDTASGGNSNAPWRNFRITSYNATEGSWLEHCTGAIGVELEPTGGGEFDADREHEATKTKLLGFLNDTKALSTTELDIEEVYEDLAASGNVFGPTFRAVTAMHLGPRSAHAMVTIPDVARSMPANFMRPHTIHPATMDAINHVAAVLFKKRCRNSPVMPTFIGELSISTNISSQTGDSLLVAASMKPQGNQLVSGDTFVYQGSGESIQPVISVHRWELMAIGEAQGEDALLPYQRRMTYRMEWQPDVNHLSDKTFHGLMEDAELFAVGYRDGVSASEAIQLNDKAAVILLRDTLRQIEGREPSAPHFERLLDWMRRFCTEDNIKSILGGELDADQEQALLKQSSSTTGAQGEMLDRVGTNLLDILTGKVEALSVMLQDNLLTRIYTEALVKSSYLQMAEYAKMLAFRQPRMNILEIGAGTGAATASLLQALDNPVDGLLLDRYCYTDISMAFVEKARERFRRWEDRMDFKTLDISKDPLEQPGFAGLEGKFDLIVASNVIHATPSLDASLANARKLLKPGGRLILIEVTRLTTTINTIFGTLPGWWMSEDGREDSPLLPVSGWDECLRRQGFGGVEIATPDHQGDTALTTMIVARAEDRHINGASGHQVQQLHQALAGVNIQAQASNFETLKIGNGAKYVLLDVAEDALLKEPSSAEFKTLQRLVTQEASVFWVSFRENDTADMQALQAMVHGFSRTARRENDSINLVNLDIREALSATDTNLEPLSKVVADLVNGNFWGPEDENELAISHGQVLIPRIRSDVRFNEWVDSRRTDGTTSLQPYRSPDRPLKLEAETPGLLNSLRFVDDPVPKTALGPDEIQVEARAYGINFKDVFVAMGQMAPDVVMAGEAVGVVTAVGDNMHKLYKVGDRVACMHAEPFASHPRVNGYHAHVLPQGMSWSDGASVIGIFYTTWWCLDQVAKLRKGQSILIHAGSGGVGQAAIMLAQHVGAEIFVTVGSQHKKDLVISAYGVPESHIFSTRSTTFKDGVLRLTGGRGVDVVLNSLSGELLDASWESVAAFGTFVEIGKADMYKRKTISMSPFDKCVSFVPVDLALMTKAKVEMTHDGLREVFSWFEKGIFRPVTPVQTFPMGDISDAFRLIAQRRHVGKLVVVADESTMVKATPPPAKQLSLEGQGTYVVVGGLGDLGKRIGRLLVSRGATHIVTLSRSIPGDDILQPWLEEIKGLGGSVHMIQCDVTDKESTKRAAVECASAGLPPVRGVVYGGMVLSDHALENMTLDQYNTAVKPKVHGTLNVHDAFTSPDLNFFILLSSTAGILGIAGQANYSAGNTFQDAFALAHNAKDGNRTRYVSLDLGAIEGTGAIDRLSAKSKDVWRRSTIVMSFEELYIALEYAISPRAAEDGFTHSILGFDRESIASVSLDTYTFSNPVFSLLPTSAVRYGEEEEVKESESGQNQVDPTKLLREAKTIEEAEAVILNATASKFSIFLDSDIPTDIPVAHLALDSLVSIELKNWMVRTFQAPLQASELAGALSIRALAKLLASRSRCISDEIRGRPAEESIPEDGEVAPQVDQADTDVALASHGWECCKNSRILPRYPLVGLDEALDYFMDNTGHFCTPQELEVLADAVDELRQPDGPARKAYAHLFKLYNDSSMDSWMYDLISDSVYLKRPHPVAPFSNVMGTHFESPIPHTQIERAAVVTLAAFDFQKKLVANEVEPYWYFGMSSCTWQWRWLFNACREPGVDGDKMRIGHVFKVSLKEATYESLKATFAAIIRAVEDEGYWTGILTTDWRPSWAKYRARAMEISPSNVEYFKAIDEATFIVCLDEGSPKTNEEHVRTAYLSDGFNRWMDKCTQFMIAENGKSSFIMEHGAIDGITASRACDFIHEAIQNHQPESTRTNGGTVGLMVAHEQAAPDVQLQEFHFQSDPGLDEHIIKLRKQYIESASSIGYKNHKITAFGTDHLMSCAVPVKTALDATVQLAIRLHYGYNTPCWEGVSMAHYHKGRPEVMQVATSDVTAFCDLALDESVPLAEKRAALFRLGRSMSGNMQKTLTGQTHLRLLDLLKVCWPTDAPTAKLFQGDIFWRNPFVIANHAPSGNKVQDSVYGVQEPNSIWTMITPGNDSIRVAVAGAAGEKTEAFAARLDDAAEIVKKIAESEWTK